MRFKAGDMISLKNERQPPYEITVTYVYRENNIYNVKVLIDDYEPIYHALDADRIDDDYELYLPNNEAREIHQKLFDNPTE
jgi:hypothetical protein